MVVRVQSKHTERSIATTQGETRASRTSGGVCVLVHVSAADAPAALVGTITFGALVYECYRPLGGLSRTAPARSSVERRNYNDRAL
jgi:hypothetical protein